MFETAGNLKMFNMLMPVDEVAFDLNPSSFTITKQAYNNNKAQTKSGKTTGVPSPVDASPAGYVSLYRGTHPTVITFTALLTDESEGIEDATAIGGGVKARCDMLLQWTQPGGGSMMGKLAGSLASAALPPKYKPQLVARPPLLTLQWGDPARGFLMQGTLTSVNIDYKRFDNIGNPIRAEVRCSFTEAPSSLLSMLTNPTSGGVPGRRAHVVRQGESLAGLATDTYGRPAAWRDIADANGIDDPFRVRPGRSVMLPPPDELG